MTAFESAVRAAAASFDDAARRRTGEAEPGGQAERQPGADHAAPIPSDSRKDETRC